MFAAEEGLLSLVIDRIDGEGGPFAGLRPVYDYLDGVRQTNARGARSRGKRSGRLPPFDVGSGQLPRTIPVAPLRSKPKRTYDPIRDSASPDGEHVPMLMMRLDRTDKPHWTSLRDDLVRFGRASRSVLEHQGEAPRPADERSVSIAGQGPHRTACEHHGRRLRDQSEPADPGGLDA